MPESTTPSGPHAVDGPDAALGSDDNELTTVMGPNATRRTTAAVPPQAPAIPEIPGFTILDQIGRGGMGVVYRARQHSPERIVALKLIRRDWLDSHAPDAQMSAIGRFRTESDAAARFEHDNIVPIYQVGQAGDQDYYVMRYVEGESLSELLRNGPLDNQQSALWLEQVASAVEEAHRHGILHRDLKPQNIMIDKPTQRALVTDFGLAKFTHQEQSQTRTGEILGTPAYMSPEQSRDAGSAGASADIYSLGATLYHMLTARPPFQAAHLVETLRQIAEVEPVSPRQINPEVDRDLETICLKCLQKEPARRYDSANSLAEDLRLYREGMPIKARPIGLAGRTWRWCLRNPGIASLVGAVAVSLVVAVGALGWGYVSTKTSLAESQLSLRRALKVVDQFCTQVSEDDLRDLPGLQPVRRDLLAQALAHYQWFLKNHRDKTAIRDELAAAHFRIGLISGEIGSQDDALAAFREARSLQQQMLAESPQSLELLQALGETANAEASLLQKMGQLDDAASMYSEAARLRQQAVDLHPRDVELRRMRANTAMNVGLLNVERERFDTAARHLEEAQSQRRKLLEEQSDNRRIQRDLGLGHFNQGKLALLRERDDEAQTHFRQAADIFEQLCRTDPDVLTHRCRLSVACRVLGDLACQKEQFDEAEAQYVRARKRIEPLAAANPAVTEFQSELASLLLAEAGAFEGLGNRAAATATFRQAHDILTELHRAKPRNRDFRRDLAVVLRALGLIDSDDGNTAAALERLEQSQRLLNELAREFPNDADVESQFRDTADALEQLRSPPKPAAAATGGNGAP